MSAEKVISHARSMLGVKWRHLGRKPWAVDCAGLVILSLESAGWPRVESPTGYGREPWDDTLRKTLAHNLGRPLYADYQPGDIALVQWVEGQPTHVGVIADYLWGGLSIIHAQNLHGVIETALTGHIADCVIEAYRPDWSRV